MEFTTLSSMSPHCRQYRSNVGWSLWISSSTHRKTRNFSNSKTRQGTKGQFNTKLKLSIGISVLGPDNPYPTCCKLLIKRWALIPSLIHISPKTFDIGKASRNENTNSLWPSLKLSCQVLTGCYHSCKQKMFSGKSIHDCPCLTASHSIEIRF